MQKPAKLTPMLKQYFDMKEKYMDCVLLFRLGDFYEMFGDDAIEISKLLGLTLTSRGQDETKIPMCGVPYHAAKRYISRLTKLGKKIAICEQLSDPSLPGIVERDVTSVITPGTTFDEYILDDKVNNYILSFTKKSETIGFAFCDITTGEFKVCEVRDFEKFENELRKIKPAEIIIDKKLSENPEIQNFLNRFDKLNISPINFENGHEKLLKHFDIKSLEGFGIEKLSMASEAASNLIEYLKGTQKTDLKHIDSIKLYNTSKYMLLDESTISNLEILFTMRECKKEGSLINVIDDTSTSMGARLLRFWILNPLLEKEEINLRQNAVEELFVNNGLRLDLEESLRNILDIERILGRIGCMHSNARDLLGLRESLKKIPLIKENLKSATSAFLKNIYDNLEDFYKLVELLDRAVLDEPSALTKEGNMIKEGYNSELDELKYITRDSKNLVADLQSREIARTGIQSLKVKFNSVFGYYIEVSKSNLGKIPDDYTRRQTLVNAERFITPELKEYEEKILGAEEKIIKLEYDIFMNLREEVLGKIREIQKSARMIASLDVILSFAKIAIKRNYIKPEISDTDEFKILNGRHPVIEAQTENSNFIANDLIMSEQSNIALLTGPNMAGKSTYLRQNALIVLLAQIGSFVPASEVKMNIVDRIFTRVGASDNLSRGQSTFMVEMQETSNILHNATEKSLIILDEIGRGTSTYDGLSIAWSIFEHIHDTIKAKTLFATHYHEMIEIAENLPRAFNLCVAVKEKEDGVIFLHKVISGGINRSYGIEVAKLAGLPKNVTNRAIEILKNLENSREKTDLDLVKTKKQKEFLENQVSLFALNNHTEHKAVKALKDMDVNNLTPMQALQKLEELKGME